PRSSGVFVFCNGFSLAGNSSVNLAAGTYIIDRGQFHIGGGSSITGSGVTIILTSSTGSDYATAQIDGGAIVTISAPTTGPLAGLAFFQDRNAPASTGSNSNKFTGGTTQNITGAIYFPNQNVTFNGGTSTGGAAMCTQLVALTINFNGNSTFNNNCAGTGARGIGTSFVQL